MADSKKIIKLNYEAYFADNDKLYDTTDAEAAKTAGIYNEQYRYEPMAYIVGSKKLFPAIDEALATAEVGKTVEVNVPCEQAAGERQSKLVELFPIKDFYKQQINPMPGMPVRLGNRNGTIVSVGSGRVKVDFNSPLAGHDLFYKLTVTEIVEDDAEKAKAVMELVYGNSDGFAFEFPGDKIVVKLPDSAKFDEKWPVAKFMAVSDLRAVFGVDVIEYVEVWATAKKE